MNVSMLLATGLCGSALAQAPQTEYLQRPQVGSCRMIFERSPDGWYWDLNRQSPDAQYAPGSFFVATIFLKIHAAADDHSPVIEEVRSAFMRDGDQHNPIGHMGRLEGRKISGITRYECKVYQWSK